MRRRLTLTDRTFLCYGKAYLVSYEIEGDGDIDFTRLSQAVAKATEVNSFVRSVLAGHLGWSYWKEKVAVPVFASKQEAAAAWVQHNPRKDPNLIVYKTEVGVGVQCHHALMDGGGVRFFLEDIFKVLRGEAPVGENATTTDVDIMLEHQPTQEEIGPQEKVELIANLPYPKTNDDLGTQIKRITIDGRFGIPMARMCCAIARVTGAMVRMQVATDIRHHTPRRERSLRNQAKLLLIDVYPEDTPQQVNDKLQKKLKAKHDLMDNIKHHKLGVWIPIFLGRFIFKKLAKIAHKKQHNAFISGIISNFGRVPKHFNCDTFTATKHIAYSQDDGIIPFFCGLSYNRESVDAVFRMANRIGSDGRMEEFLHNIENEFPLIE